MDAYLVKTIADWLLFQAALDDKFLTVIKLQKLVYIAHGWHLALYNRPLVVEPIEAWKWGPVIRILYKKFGQYGKNPIPIPSDQPVIDPSTNSFLERIWEVYGNFNSIELTAMITANGTPWKESFHPETKALIHNEEIREYYKYCALDCASHNDFVQFQQSL